MIQQIKLLCSLQMKNIFGFNEFRYSKNRKKQVSYVAVALLCLIPVGMLVWLSVFLAKQLVNIRMSQLIPVFLYVVISVSILFLNVLNF